MTRIPDSQFRDPAQLNLIPNLSSSRVFRGVPGSFSLGNVCQDSDDPRKILIDFSLAGYGVDRLEVSILSVDGDTSYATSSVIAPIILSDARNFRFPISYSQGPVSGKVVADFGIAIPELLTKTIIIFRVSAFDRAGSVLSSVDYTWSKANLPRPVGMNYSNGSLQFLFQYDGEQNCSCDIQCVIPSGVTTNLTFCPEQTQTINLEQVLDGDPFNFSIVVRDALGNTSTLNSTTILNVVPQPPSLGIAQKDRHNAPVGTILVNPQSTNNIEIKYRYYQIIRYESTPNNYQIWKDWTDSPETVLYDDKLKIGKDYGYAIRYKGEYNDITEFSSWAILSTNFEYEDFTSPDLSPFSYGFGEWVERFNHTGGDTDAFIAFPETDFRRAIALQNYGEYLITGRVWPPRFKAAHASIIPKGRYRGHIIAWDTAITIGVDEKICPGEEIAFQYYTIIDPKPASGQPRFRNFLVPLGPAHPPPPDALSGDTSVLWSNLFCNGHTWTHNGDLIMAGGAYVSESFQQYALDKTYIWNPAGPSTYFFKTESGVDRYGTLDKGHYDNDGAGSWIQGPYMEQYRYYPTTTLSHSLSRVGTGCPVVYIFGGANPGWDSEYGNDETIPGYSGFNSYEALQVTGNPLGRDCGYSKDYYNASYIWNGPGTGEYNKYYEDTLYFYPRMYVLSNGGVFMAGMAAKSSTLLSHDDAPGFWTQTEGHAYRKNRVNSFRDYGNTAFYATGLGKSDYVVRLGGGTIYDNTIISDNNITGWENSNVESINAAEANSDWQKLPHLDRARNLSNSIMLPDGSIFVVGGGQIIIRLQANNELVPYPYRRPGAGTEFTLAGPVVDPESPWAQLHGLHGGHDAVGNLDALTDVYENSIASTLTSLAESSSLVSNNTLTDPEKEGVIFNAAQDNIIRVDFVFHYVPETFLPGQAKSIPQRWSPAATLRQYHSTTLLLPDGRVFVGGGEGRETYSGYDYEIYEPHYIRPITAFSGLVYPRPESLVITDAIINPNPAHNAYDLDYATEYTLQCSSSILPDALTKVVMMSPCAATHHADMHQRYIECKTETRESELKITFRTPENDARWQKGFHMLFGVSNKDVPSEAIWVKF